MTGTGKLIVRARASQRTPVPASACRREAASTDFGMRLAERSLPVIERLDPDMVAVYRAMTPAQRIVSGLSATDLIRERLLASLRELRPEWTAEAISRAVSWRMLSAGD